MNSRIKELDGIRGIAIILIIIWHYLSSCEILPAPYAHPFLAVFKKATRLTATRGRQKVIPTRIRIS